MRTGGSTKGTARVYLWHSRQASRHPGQLQPQLVGRGHSRVPLLVLPPPSCPGLPNQGHPQTQAAPPGRTQAPRRAQAPKAYMPTVTRPRRAHHRVFQSVNDGRRYHRPRSQGPPLSSRRRRSGVRSPSRASAPEHRSLAPQLGTSTCDSMLSCRQLHGGSRPPAAEAFLFPKHFTNEHLRHSTISKRHKRCHNKRNTMSNTLSMCC